MQQHQGQFHGSVTSQLLAVHNTAVLSLSFLAIHSAVQCWHFFYKL